jgi:hypothetical protein
MAALFLDRALRFLALFAAPDLYLGCERPDREFGNGEGKSAWNENESSGFTSHPLDAS